MTDEEFNEVVSNLVHNKYISWHLLKKFIEYAKMGRKLEEKNHFLYALEGLKDGKSRQKDQLKESLVLVSKLSVCIIVCAILTHTQGKWAYFYDKGFCHLKKGVWERDGSTK